MKKNMSRKAGTRSAGKILFITGGQGGIGRGIIKKFKAAGFKVISPTSRELDLSSPAGIKAYFKKFTLKIDVFIHCAGVNWPETIAKMDGVKLEKTMEINALSFARLIKVFYGNFKAKKAGHILAISSLWGFSSRPGRGAYAASKHALNGLVKTLALELGPLNVKVNALSPGFVNSRMTVVNNSAKIINSWKKQIPLGRLAQANDIANVAYFLCSPENSYLTGQNIVVDGGFSAGYLF